MPAPSPALEDYTRDALHILKRSLQLAATGEPAFYRVAALQLRLLLCDTTRRHNRIENTALVPQLFPDLHLPSLQPDGRPDTARPPLALETWLNQPLNIPSAHKISLHSLIRRVCDQDGGAHVDPRPHAGLGDVPDHQVWILHIGKLVAEALDERMRN
jgi:hypothetical protein